MCDYWSANGTSRRRVQARTGALRCLTTVGLGIFGCLTRVIFVVQATPVPMIGTVSGLLRSASSVLRTVMSVSNLTEG